MGRPQTRAPAPPPAAAQGSTAPDTVSEVDHADAPVETPLLHTAVAHAAISAQRRGDYTAHAALYTLESALGEVRVKVAAARSTLGADYADLLDRISSIV